MNDDEVDLDMDVSRGGQPSLAELSSNLQHRPFFRTRQPRLFTWAASVL